MAVPFTAKKPFGICFNAQGYAVTTRYSFRYSCGVRCDHRNIVSFDKMPQKQKQLIPKGVIPPSRCINNSSCIPRPFTLAMQGYIRNTVGVKKYC